MSDDIYKATGFDCDEGNIDKMQNISKDIPHFTTEEAERAFWATYDSTEFIDWGEAKAVVLPALKPSTKSISPRLPESIGSAGY